VVECARLEIECTERYRGFESHPLRFTIARIDKNIVNTCELSAVKCETEYAVTEREPKNQ
jgi:hypothetical protein